VENQRRKEADCINSVAIYRLKINRHGLKLNDEI